MTALNGKQDTYCAKKWIKLTDARRNIYNNYNMSQGPKEVLWLLVFFGYLDDVLKSLKKNCGILFGLLGTTY